MTRPIIFDGEKHREMTELEHDEWLAHITELEARAAELEIKAAERQAVLDKLGLDEDEVAALFG